MRKVAKLWVFRVAKAKISASGNAITEYALVSVLVIVVCITAMQLLGNGFHTAMANIRDDVKSHNQATIAIMKQKNAQAAGYISSTSMSQAQLADLQMSLSEKLQTTGANGSTNMLSDQIASAATLLFSEGKIDQSQYDILMKLSNQGHQIAQIESIVADALKTANGDATAFANIKITWEGQTYTAAEMSGLIGFDAVYPSDFTSPTSNILAQQTGAKAEISDFLSLYNEAMASGALSDPALKATVESASTQIASMGELVEDSVWHFTYYGESGTLEAVNARAASTATTMNSTNVCTAGSFQDNGILCTP
jgi:Flp pilus assembly pilin Flp